MRLGEVTRVGVWMKQRRGPQVEAGTLQHSEVSRGTDQSGKKIPGIWRPGSQGKKQFGGRERTNYKSRERRTWRSLATSMGCFSRVGRHISRKGESLTGAGFREKGRGGTGKSQ